MTYVYRMNNDDTDAEKIEKCSEIISSGGIVAFPTETVYGLGASAFDEKACEKIYTAKGRPPKKPLSCLVSSLEQASLIADVSGTATQLLKEFSPGPLTIILPKKSNVPYIVTAGGDTVAVRIPDNRYALALIDKCGVPLATPSANISGMPSPKCADDVLSQLDGRIDALIDGGRCEIGTESTIVLLKDGKGKILRQGALPKEKIEKYIELAENE